MRKKAFIYCAILFTLLLMNAFCYAEDLRTYLREKMNIRLTLPAGVVLVPQVEQEEVDYQFAFRYPNKDYEIRCSFWPLDHFNGDAPSIPFFVDDILFNIAQDESNVGPMHSFSEEDTKAHFGADIGAISTITGEASLFSKGFKYVDVMFFIKVNSGLAIIFMLYNDPEVKSEQEYIAAYHCIFFD